MNDSGHYSVTFQVAAGMLHGLALSHLGKLYFWGDDGRCSSVTVPEEVRFKAKVEDIAALSSCSLSVCKTEDDTVHFWGYHYGTHILRQKKTKFSTMDQVFAALDVPLMLNPLKFDCLGQPFSEKMELAFNDTVISSYFSLVNKTNESILTFVYVVFSGLQG